jgi:uncharacterized cupin superfamily protein
MILHQKVFQCKPGAVDCSIENAFETVHFLSGLNALDQSGNRLRLIAGRLEWGAEGKHFGEC